MPLHLLGKKSWNVYNTANIEKVKRDEAKAAAQEEAEELRLQEVDDQRRLRILRGEQVEALSPPGGVEGRVEDGVQQSKRDDHHHHERDGSRRDDRKRRRIAGEDDTDREIRFAREDRAILPAKTVMQMTSEKSSGAPLMDTKGHINLFPLENRSHKETKNAEVEAEKARKERELEDQYTMRFSNAAGFKQAVDQKPWYENVEGANEGVKKEETLDISSSKDVWGQEDPRRKGRERMRMAADDPLAMMRNGAAGVREAEKQRMKWREEKAKEIREIEDDERRRKRRRRRRHDESDSYRSRDRHGRHGKDEERAPDQSHRHHSHSQDRDRHRSHHQGSRAHY